MHRRESASHSIHASSKCFVVTHILSSDSAELSTRTNPPLTTVVALLYLCVSMSFPVVVWCSLAEICCLGCQQLNIICFSFDLVLVLHVLLNELLLATSTYSSFNIWNEVFILLSLPPRPSWSFQQYCQHTQSIPPRARRPRRIPSRRVDDCGWPTFHFPFPSCRQQP